MKTLFTALLAASALIPAAAQAQRMGARADIGSDVRGDRSNGGDRTDRPNWRDRRGADVRVDAGSERPGFDADRQRDFGDRGPEPRDPRVGDERDAQRGTWNGAADRGRPARPSDDGRRDGQWSDRGDSPQVRADDRGNDRREAARGRPGWENYSAFRSDNFGSRRGDWRSGHAYGDRGQQWNRGWRNDERYDWNRYRAINRGAYRLPRYYAPSGWGYGYRRFSIGVTLSAGLWDQNYWIDDPYAYRLPEAYGPYRWVRYYGDALLIDLRSGRVVDTVYDIFY